MFPQCIEIRSHASSIKKVGPQLSSSWVQCEVMLSLQHRSQAQMIFFPRAPLRVFSRLLPVTGSSRPTTRSASSRPAPSTASPRLEIGTRRSLNLAGGQKNYDIIPYLIKKRSYQHRGIYLWRQKNSSEFTIRKKTIQDLTIPIWYLCIRPCKFRLGDDRIG